MPTDLDIMGIGLRLLGGRYVFGAKNPPIKSDCSGYISGICRVARIPMGAGSMGQKQFCRQRGLYKGGRAGVEWALDHPGSLLFRDPGAAGPIGHVGLVGKNRKVLQYKGTNYGSGVWPADGSVWTGGALIPGVSYGQVPLQVPTSPLPVRPELGPGSAPSHCIAIASFYLKMITGHAIPQVDQWNAFLESTVRDLQRLLHMPVTGRLDKNTWAAIDMIVISRGQKPVAC